MRSFSPRIRIQTQWILTAASLIIIGLLWWYIQGINKKIRTSGQGIAQLYVELFSEVWAKTGSDSRSSKERLRRILREREIPFIITNRNNTPLDWANIAYPEPRPMMGKTIGKNNLSPPEKIALLTRLERYKKSNRLIRFGGKNKSDPSFIIYYGFPDHLKNYFWLPIVEVVIIAGFVIAMLIGIRSRRNEEEGSMWIRFAKETAHQLGTPISSLLGWIEMMKLRLNGGENSERYEDPETILKEMSADIGKLDKIVLRFSQIGSTPVLTKLDLNMLIRGAVNYFKERIPQTGKQVQIVANFGTLPMVRANKDLMEWVHENLIKNSVDAITKQEGIIEIETAYNEKTHIVRITHSDNGAGIKKEIIKRIFDPGFSTKKRGWGLGLALARRIITHYHGGRIFVETSQLDRGSTFVIELPAVEPLSTSSNAS